MCFRVYAFVCEFVPVCLHHLCTFAPAVCACVCANCIAASNCYLHKGMHADVKGSALMQVTITSCIGHSNGAHACPVPL